MTGTEKKLSANFYDETDGIVNGVSGVQKPTNSALRKNFWLLLVTERHDDPILLPEWLILRYVSPRIGVPSWDV